MADFRRTERLLWVVGSVCLGYCLYLFVAVRWVEARAGRVVSSGVAEHGAVRGDAADGSDDVMGRLEIPALSLSVAVLKDYDPASLREGVGHIGGTAMPGGLGTVGLAGHRDTFFRPLRRIAPKMEIRLGDRTGVYRYVVDGTEIVTPEQVSVLAIRARPELTLITCFPFDYVGAAPRRFIVHAHLLSAAPDQLPAGR